MSSMLKKNIVHHFQRGISLIELMVAMTIGSFLVLGITQIFITSQKNYLFQQSQLGNQENGRFALVVLGQELSKAGYRSKPTTLFAASSAVVSGCNFPEGASVVALSTTSLCIQYQASNRAEITCQGAALSGADQATIVSPYGQINPLIVEKIEFDKNTNSITCTTGGATQQLVTGVADIHFDYGSGDNKTVTAFGSSPTLTVGAVRYAALMQNGTSTIRDTTTVPKVLSDWKNRFGGTVSDNTKIYQIVQSTIMLRNQMQ